MFCPVCRALNDGRADACFQCGRNLTTLQTGEVLSGRYEIVALLGKGGMGTVYKAHDRELEEMVSLKVLRFDLVASPSVAKRFRSEIKLARRVAHPNVCRIFEYGQHDQLRFIVMEYVEGDDLKHIIRQRPLGVAEAFEIAIQVAKGLQAVHNAGIVHRDLKTTNIMRDEKGMVRVLDFGIAKQYDAVSTDSTGTGQVIGTPEYMSPEQARGEKVDVRCDIYTFGIVLFELFTGEVPFRADTPVAVMLKHLQEPPPIDAGPLAARLPPGVVPVLRNCLAKAREARYDSMRAVIAALRQAREEVLATGTPASGPSGLREAETESYGTPVPTPIPTPVPVPTPNPAAPSPGPVDGWSVRDDDEEDHTPFVRRPDWLSLEGVVAHSHTPTPAPVVPPGPPAVRPPPPPVVYAPVPPPWSPPTPAPVAPPPRSLNPPSAEWPSARDSDRRASPVVIAAVTAGVLLAALAIALALRLGGQRQAAPPPPTESPSAASPAPAPHPWAARTVPAVALTHGTEVRAVAFVPGRSWLASGGEADGSADVVKVWDLSAAPEIRAVRTLRVNRGDRAPGIGSLAFAPDGAWMATASELGRVHLWRVSDWRQRNTLPGSFAVAFDPRGGLLATYTGPDARGHGVALWDLGSVPVAPREVLELPAERRVYTLALGADARLVAARDSGGGLNVWSRPDGQHRRLECAEAGSVAFSPDDRLVASHCGTEQTVWRVSDWQPVAHLAGSGALAFSPDGTVLAAHSGTGEIRLWAVPREGNLRYEEIRAPLTGHAGRVTSIAFSADGHSMASGGSDGTVRLWDLDR